MDGETPNAQAMRLEELWTTLDAKKTGHLDLAGLKRGLKKMDHPLKHADSLVEDVMQSVDTNKDGRITFAEFQTFVKQTERELYYLFKRIDHNEDGKLDKAELKQAFQTAGLAVPDSKFERFFEQVDSNQDGVITFDEWRDFLLFIPSGETDLRAVLSYFTSTFRMNPEGDAQISDDIIDGLGIQQQFLNILFGEIVRIAKPPKPRPPASVQNNSSITLTAPHLDMSSEEATLTLPPKVDTVEFSPDVSEPETDSAVLQLEQTKPVLILIPYSGYFVAGGISGIVSRTATAPLDRLKVYLIAQTSVTSEAVQAAKSGNPFAAIGRAWRPIANAMKDLWQAGGIRSLYAGNGLNVVKVMPESAIKFGSYEATKRFFATLEGIEDPNNIHSYAKFMAGGVAGMVSQFAVYPMDTLKFRMQCETVKGGLHGNQLIITTAKKMWAKNGVVAFYRGLPMGLVGIFPYAAIDLGTFEYLKRALARRKAKKLGCHEEQAQPSSFATACIGGFSGAFGASMVYPLNLLRTRLQSQGTVLHPRTYTGIMDVTRQTIKGEGYRGLFKGLTPNLFKVVPAVSITYVVYEQSKLAMGLP
ncbi:calcium dependent mitochondrial carrier protein-like protein [Pseudovirgaria hyperparasitica]|uniref:Mitochondrial thiamine pyrophosphate carrier 1 n=1 Tax=Pseudovirgaria hyperparasitica TaxID=470096 RepID=A0A6A6WI76_9PEZI|nr:calcium dependent mitochondrial carrier protein-like protein [Pseudovirgaria hyperparasitica]KAF2761805.1 calcium dependent mitochondrial carrier protein-like protein [Pseudovirgaria hyperparasitica]